MFVFFLGLDFENAQKSQNKTIIGVGITMEGIWQNYCVFEYTLRLTWNFDTDVDNYFKRYGVRRYGQQDESNFLRVLHEKLM